MATIAAVIAPSTSTSGRLDDEIAKIEPNRIEIVAPVVLLSLVPRYRNSAARPKPKPSTIPVARSRPRTRWMPISSIAAEAATEIPGNPQSGPIPIR